MVEPLEPTQPRFGSFFINGETWRLAEDATVRAKDLSEGTLTLTRPDTGEGRVVRTAEIQGPPIEGLEEIPDEDRYDLRKLVEDMLTLGFDSTQADVIMGLVTRRRLLRERRS